MLRVSWVVVEHVRGCDVLSGIWLTAPDWSDSAKNYTYHLILVGGGLTTKVDTNITYIWYQW